MKNDIKVFSGIQPSGKLHLGNYLGMLKQSIDLQDEFPKQCMYCIVDLHAITVPYEPEELGVRTMSAAIDMMALGINPKKATLFVQSHVPEHTELMWLLNTVVPFGELQRMTQWKDKTKRVARSKEDFYQKFSDFIEFDYSPIKLKDIIGNSKIADNPYIKKLKVFQLIDMYKAYKEHMDKTDLIKTNAGLLNYPILMAADILLYKAKIVPVGEDQQQHVELARSFSRKMNTTYKTTFQEPEARLAPTARIMSLTEPEKKMSKSDNEKSYIALADSPETIEEKISKATTTPAGVENLLAIAQALEPEAIPEMKELIAKKNNKDMKLLLTDVIVEHFEEYRKKRTALIKKPHHVQRILEEGAKRAKEIGEDTMEEVREKMGLE